MGTPIMLLSFYSVYQTAKVLYSEIMHPCNKHLVWKMFISQVYMGNINISFGSKTSTICKKQMKGLCVCVCVRERERERERLFMGIQELPSQRIAKLDT